MGFPTTAGSLAAWTDQNANIPGTGTPVNATSVNAIITEINAITNTLGASALALSNLAENPATTTALIWGYQAGRVVEDNVVRTIVAGTVNLVDNATNYIEFNTSNDTMYCQQGGAFTSGRKPIAKVITSGGSITQTVALRDQRTWLNVFPGTPLYAAGNYTVTGAWIFSKNSAVSLPTASMTGTWYAGGSATTTKPHFLIETTGTTSTGWATTGTGFGINAASGFVGNLLDAQLNGVSKFKVDYTGLVTTAVAIPTASGGTGLSGATPFTANGIFYASSTSAMANSGPTWNGTTLGVRAPNAGGDIEVLNLSIGSGGVIGSQIIRLGALVADYGATIRSTYDYTGHTGNTLVFATRTTAGVLTDALTLGYNQSATFASTVGVTTSLTTPIIYGGSAAGSTLSLASTSNGAASADAVYIKGGNNGATTWASFVGGLTTLTSTTQQLKLVHTAATWYTDFTVSGAGVLTIAPNGGATSVTGGLAVGAGAPFVGAIGVDNVLTVKSASYYASMELASGYADTASAQAVAYLNFVASGNTKATSPTRKNVAAIAAYTDTGGTANARGGQLRFYTQADDAVGGTERMSIASTGLVTIASGLTVTAGGATITAGNVYLGDTANDNMTLGLTINQGAADNEIVAFKSSDVVHAFTDLAEADTYMDAVKYGTEAGGVQLRGFTEATVGIGLGGAGVTDITARNTSALAYVMLTAYKLSTNTVGDAGADANLVAIQNNGTTRFIFDAEGSAHADVEWIAFDSYDDMGLLNALNDELVQRKNPSLVNKEWSSFMKENRDALQGEKIVNFYDDGPRAMLNTTRLSMLHTGAIRQVGKKLVEIDKRDEVQALNIEALISRIGELEREVKLLREKN